MKARVILPFRGVKDGETHPHQFKDGDEITGELAKAMVEAGYAKSLGGAPENKAGDGSKKKPGGPTGPAKPSSSPRAGRAKGVKTSKKRGEKPAS